ncbi:peroxidase 31 [Phtheirospermum japonicum]|uniref:peroxidase n=1 Tax=Phtheirospermum japonicum TaxID=374723 RepID=A0A830BIS0_9LAMI|nr:peroxidase 31 [Phtheirospermum japonicum]
MAPPLLALLLSLLPSPIACSQPPPLSTDHYSKSCPKFKQIVEDTTTDKQIKSPTTAAAALRLFFHECFVGDCDASILVSSTRLGKRAERDANINLSLPGDGFDVIVRAKTAIELACPGVISCADILAVASRNLVVMMGGPYYEVALGRKDSLTSRADDVEGNIPRPTTPMDQMIQIFVPKGFSVQEMVAAGQNFALFPKKGIVKVAGRVGQNWSVILEIDWATFNIMWRWFVSTEFDRRCAGRRANMGVGIFGIVSRKKRKLFMVLAFGLTTLEGGIV